MRGCQSIFSIICKLNNVNRLSATECEWAENNSQRTWSHLNDYPILAKRDKNLIYLKDFLIDKKKP